MATVSSLLAEAKAELAAAPFRPSPREAHLLLGHVLGLAEAPLLARDAEAVPPASEEAFRALLARRLTGEPVAYLLGEREFFGRPFAVDGRVLVPRPETEHLVETVLDLPLPVRARVLDVGVGSGAIAVTLAHERPAWRVTGVDLSPAALAVARGNARRHAPAGGRLALAAADLAAGLDLSGFDLLVSNPPYVAWEDAPTLSPEVRDFEPGLALFAEPAGPAGEGVPGAGVTARLLQQSRLLPLGARVVLELGSGQLEGLLRLAAAEGWSPERVVHDYAGIPRVVVLGRP